MVAGTPSGVTLAPEGGAHQSTITASVGLELPGVTLIEPAYARGAGLAALRRARPDRRRAGRRRRRPPRRGRGHGAYYFRLTTRPIDQAPFEAARARLGDAVLRRQVLAGAYRLVDAYGRTSTADAPAGVTSSASGAVLPEVLAAAAELADEGIAAHVVDVTSLDRLYARLAADAAPGRPDRDHAVASPARCGPCSPDRAPVVTVHDAASHAMAWLGSALGVPAVPARRRPVRPVRHRRRPLRAARPRLPGSIVNAALAAISLR